MAERPCRLPSRLGHEASRPKAPLSLWVLLTALLLGVAPARAQLPAASAAVLATAGAYRALARGAVAAGANPAGLGMPDGPTWSLIVPAVRLQTGLDPVTLHDLSEFDGRTVPPDVKLAWLDRIEGAGRQHGMADGDLTAVAFSHGSWGVQLSGLAGADVSLDPDAAELLLFGNAGRTGEPRELDLTGSRFDAYAVTTLGVSAGVPVSLGPRGSFAVGATIGLSLGHALLLGRDAGSFTSGDPLELGLDFPVVQPDFGRSGIGSGFGVGVNVAGAWERGRWSAGVVLENVIQTFRWETSELVFRPGQALFDVHDFESDFDQQPLAEAPSDLRRQVKDLTFRPRVSLGVAHRTGSALTLTAEVQRRLGKPGLRLDPRSRLGAGAQYRIGRVALRGGAGYVTDGWTLTGGVGVELGPVDVEGAGAVQGGGAGHAASWMFSLSFQPGSPTG